MAQDILTVSQEEFEAALPKISTFSLKNLLTGIRGFLMKSSNGRIDLIMDLERKQSKIIKELQRRKYLTKKDRVDFHKFHMNTKGWL